MRQAVPRGFGFSDGLFDKRKPMGLRLVSFVLHCGMPEKRLLVGQSQYLLHRDLVFVPLENQYPAVFQYAEAFGKGKPQVFAPILAECAVFFGQP